MTPRHITTGQNNWHYRTGYKHTPRVPGPILPMDQPTIWQRLFGRVK